MNVEKNGDYKRVSLSLTRSIYNWCGHSLFDLKSLAGLVNILRQSSSSPSSLSPSLSSLSLHTYHRCSLCTMVAHCTKVIGSILEGDRKGQSTLALQGVHCAQGTSMICMHWSSLSLGQSRPKDNCLPLTGAQTDLFEKIIIFHHLYVKVRIKRVKQTDTRKRVLIFAKVTYFRYIQTDKYHHQEQ